uniref:Protein kinase domain-containing protein n=1 Tax=Setaria viridis TaxID=4556 RepID=A0A4U6TTU0_SETVI|nr:hypothetical protein SEVIR_7G115800v2 [Setaria viridis]
MDNFQAECLLGEGGFGRVYRGRLESGQMVAVKQLDREGPQGNREFVVEVLMLSLLHHPNLMNLRLLVYEYMVLGSLADHLLLMPGGDERHALSWETRMRYLHETTHPSVIYRDLKSSNALLDDALCPKLSDFGLAKLDPVGDRSPRVMGTYCYCAPEYVRAGNLTIKTDIYSFGVLLLELVTGRRAVDSMLELLVAWARPMLRDGKRDLKQAVAVAAAMCLQDEASARPLMRDAAVTLEYLAEILPLMRDAAVTLEYLAEVAAAADAAPPSTS